MEYNKLLDKGDIESFGFEKSFIPNCFKEEDEIESGYQLQINKTDSINLHLWENNIISIYRQHIYNEISTNWTVDYLFKRIIKNKNEFKKLLKQLQIN